jgi:type VI secretion system FHA domain protein
VPRNDAILLTLEVTGPEAERLGSERHRVFGARSATIGRTDDNDWILPHALVSSHHAVIEFVDGAFYITDTNSTNGVYITSKTNRLPPGRRAPVQSGDLIIIEPFRIRASVSQPAADAGPRRAPEARRRGAGEVPQPPLPAEDPFAWPGTAPDAAPGGAPKPVAASDEVDPLVLLGVSDAGAPPRHVPRASDLAGASPLEDHFKPPAPGQPVPPPRPQALIPEDYDPASSQSGPLPVAPPPEPKREVPWKPAPGRAAAPAQPFDRGARSELEAILAGAGLPNASVSPQLAGQLGAILRVVVTGVMDLLRARQQIKDEFRMRATRFMPEANNALKFSANVNDALHNLLVKQNAAYLGPVEAFEDAFNDLRNHQMAMLAGMRMAFESMLADFDPDRLQGQFDRRVKKSLLGSGPGDQYWELYRERAQDLAKDIEATFRELFGDRFVSAYEQQLDQLSTRSKRGKP